MTHFLENRIDEIITLCKKHKVRSISLFGSAARNTMNVESDVDLLVDFSEDVTLLDYADNYFSLIDGLERITGRKVDLLTTRSLRNPILKRSIDSSKIDLYAA